MVSKKRLPVLFLLAALLTTSVSAAGYKDVTEAKASGNCLAARALVNGVAVLGKRLVCVGPRGNIVYSDDRGKTWAQATVPVQSDLVAVSFPTPAHGWAVGHDGVILHSTDGGATWAKQFDGTAAARALVEAYGKGSAGTVPAGDPKAPILAEEAAQYQAQGADKPFLDVWFENESVGYVVGAFNLIFRTADGGKSWIPLFDRIDNPSRLHLYAIRPIGKDLFVSGEQGSLFKLDRQSGRFRALKTPYKGTFFGIAGNKDGIVAFGMRGNAFRSRNGGGSWQKVTTGVQAGLTGGALLRDGRIVLVSQAGDILVSKDDGASFARVPIGQPYPATAVAELDGATLAVAGMAGLKLQPLR